MMSEIPLHFVGGFECVPHVVAIPARIGNCVHV
jgi:hypothetical protein